MTKTSGVVFVLFALCVPLGAQQWVSIGPNGGPIYCGTVAPGAPPTLYVVSTNTSYPLLKSADNGASWTTTAASLTNYPRMLVAHPTDPDRLYGIVSSIFYRTTNAGATWTQSSLGSNTNGNDIAVNPLNPQVIYVPCYKYDGAAWKPTAAKSTDGGASWTTTQLDTLTSSTIYSVAIDPADTSVVYIGGYVNSMTVVYKTTDCGVTWNPCTFPENYNSVYSLFISPADHNIVFAGALSGICRSTDGGGTWTRVSTSSYNYRIVAAPDNPDIMYSAAYSSVYRSTNGGLNWAIAGSGIRGTTIRTVLAPPGLNGTVLAGSTAGMFKSTDYGAIWTAANSGIVIGKIPAISVNPHESNTVVAEFLDNDLFKTTDDGMTWTPQNTPLSCGNICNIAFDRSDPQRIWMLEGSG
ncbi:hypothetical protein FJY69_01055 [candidate division WOR-3 bacterium]|nr:hypothetical protein [candidate division WOR-3 bacterium]